MYRLLTADDITDILLKGKQRGWNFIFSKLSPSKRHRTKTAFNKSATLSSNWWQIPYVKERWNKKITGNKCVEYKQYLMETILAGQKDLTLLSLGSGGSGHEIEMAQNYPFKKITCVDLSEYRMAEARKTAQQAGLKNIEFICSRVEDFHFEKNHFDVVYFHSSLHHFSEVDDFLSEKISPCLKNSGVLVINEFVGPDRLQFPKHQIKKVNEAIQVIPKKYRQRFNTTQYKNSFSGSGIVRVYMADPSECVDSSSILPSIHSRFKTVVEKPYGGNILMNALKDIAHHFVDLDAEKKEVLDRLFALEDEYLESHPSDFVFGVYKKKP